MTANAWGIGGVLARSKLPASTHFRELSATAAEGVSAALEMGERIELSDEDRPQGESETDNERGKYE